MHYVIAKIGYHAAWVYVVIRPLPRCSGRIDDRSVAEAIVIASLILSYCAVHVPDIRVAEVCCR